MPSQADIKRAAKRRDKIVDYVAAWHATRGYGPSMVELAEHFGVSLRAIVKDLDRLALDGRITRDKGVSRSIRIPPAGADD